MYKNVNFVRDHRHRLKKIARQCQTRAGPKRTSEKKTTESVPTMQMFLELIKRVEKLEEENRGLQLQIQNTRTTRKSCQNNNYCR